MRAGMRFEALVGVFEKDVSFQVPLSFGHVRTVRTGERSFDTAFVALVRRQILLVPVPPAAR